MYIYIYTSADREMDRQMHACIHRLIEGSRLDTFFCGFGDQDNSPHRSPHVLCKTMCCPLQSPMMLYQLFNEEPMQRLLQG